MSPGTTLREARDLLRSHRADEAGMCAGCRELWQRLAPFPCTQVDWARAVVGRIPSPETLTTLGLRELVPFYRGL
jgi:hypothetical protein